MRDDCLVSEGWFWSTGGGRVRGEFEAKPGQNAEVSLASAVSDDPRVTVEHPAPGITVTSMAGEAAKYVAAFTRWTCTGNWIRASW